MYVLEYNPFRASPLQVLSAASARSVLRASVMSSVSVGSVRRRCLLRSSCFGRIRRQHLLHCAYVPQLCPLPASAPLLRTSLLSAVSVYSVLRASLLSTASACSTMRTPLFSAFRHQRSLHYASVLPAASAVSAPFFLLRVS